MAGARVCSRCRNTGSPKLRLGWDWDCRLRDNRHRCMSPLRPQLEIKALSNYPHGQGGGDLGPSLRITPRSLGYTLFHI